MRKKTFLLDDNLLVFGLCFVEAINIMAFIAISI